MLQNELDVATKMQQSILPTKFPSGPDYRSFASMEPARNVGGDFYDVIPLENGRIGLTIADVSGKGVPAALFMMSSRTLLKGAAIGNHEPGDVLREVNNLLVEDNETMMFVTLFYALYDPHSGLLTYANGGHNAPLIRHADGSSTLLPLTGGIALGVIDGIEYEQAEVRLERGETLILYTDGVTEAMNEAEEEFGLDRLAAVLTSHPSNDPEEVNGAIFEAVRAFAGDAPQSDDITCLTLCRSEAP